MLSVSAAYRSRRRFATVAVSSCIVLTAAPPVPVVAATAKLAVAGHSCRTLGATSRSANGTRLDCVQTKTRVLWEPAGSRWNPSPNNVAPFPAAPPPVLESPTHSTSAVLNQEPLDWATDMVAHIAEIDTDYDHGLGPVTWAGQHDATTYASRTDCSGFILYVDPGDACHHRIQLEHDHGLPVLLAGRPAPRGRSTRPNPRMVSAQSNP